MCSAVAVMMLFTSANKVSGSPSMSASRNPRHV